MAELIRRRWEPTDAGRAAGIGAVVPVLPADLVADLSDAEAAVRALGSDSGGGRGRSGVVSVEGIARVMLRAESVASSKTEGLDVGPRRLMDAELLAARRAPVLDRVALEVLGWSMRGCFVNAMLVGSVPGCLKPPVCSRCSPVWNVRWQVQPVTLVNRNRSVQFRVARVHDRRVCVCVSPPVRRRRNERPHLHR